MARPRVKIDQAELEKLCGMQCTDEETAAWFGCSTRTIERLRASGRYNERMDRARAKGRVSVRRMLFAQAAKGNVAAAIFLAKNILGYRDVLTSEHSGPGGGPIAFASQTDLSKLSDEELELLQALMAKAQRQKKE